MSPLFGRDKHVYVGSDDGEGRCVRCQRPKTDHAERPAAAHYMTMAGVTRAERERLARELVPNGLTRR